MNIIRKNLSDLQRPERNVRIHNSKQLCEFKRSLKMFGQIRPLVIDEAGVILAGNGLYEAMLALDYAEADCYVVVDLSEAQKKKLMLADNRIYDLGCDDIDTLDAFIKELGEDVDIPGFDAELLQALAMEAEAATEALCEYGMIDEAKAAEIINTHERYKMQEQSLSDKTEFAESILEKQPPDNIQNLASQPPAPINIAQTKIDKQHFVVCPKCGEQIWL